MMIGGGGTGCGGDDHGIGITKNNKRGRFGGSQSYIDFGYCSRIELHPTVSRKFLLRTS